MDPGKKYFPYRLYRNNCTTVKVNGKEIYIKDLSLTNGIEDVTEEKGWRK